MRVPASSAPRRRHALIAHSACWALALAALLFAAIPPSASAGTEEWSTFDPQAQEYDDESTLDHMLDRTPREWRDQWEHSPRAFRTSQGCLTAGVWFIESELKLETPLGKRTDLGILYRQNETDADAAGGEERKHVVEIRAACREHRDVRQRIANDLDVCGPARDADRIDFDDMRARIARGDDLARGVRARAVHGVCCKRFPRDFG